MRLPPTQMLPRAYGRSDPFMLAFVVLGDGFLGPEGLFPLDKAVPSVYAFIAWTVFLIF
jgi:hypothetical protein